jgi:arylsulfatase A-like enzyme
MLILRGPGFEGRVCDDLVSQLDLYPTLCELAGIERPAWASGRSLLGPERNDAVFAEMTYHAAYEPQRAVRTTRYKYIRRYTDGLVLANIDDSPTKDHMLAHGLPEPAREQLFDLERDAGEQVNLAGDPACAAVLRDLRARLDAWMDEHDDPLRHGPVRPPAGARLNLPTQRSAEEPTVLA